MSELFDQIYEQADCRTVAGKHLEPARGRGKFFCPECGKGNLEVKEKTWTCWSCGTQSKRADAVGLVAVACGLSRIDAARLLAADLGILAELPRMKPSRNNLKPACNQLETNLKPTLKLAEPYDLESWAAALTNACRVAHDRLMSRTDDTSRRAWDYLTGPKRNLIPETIQHHGLGLNLDWMDFHEPLPGADKPCRLSPGIVIPWLAGPLGIAGANVRQFHVELKDKYLMATGSRRRWMFPKLEPWAGPVLIVEGEFDAMAADQELSGLLPVATLGGAQCKPEDTLDAIKLGRFSHLLIAADADDAGQACREMWLDFSPRRATPVDLPGGKDLTEAIAAGVDLRRWIMDVCTNQGIDLFKLPGLIWESPLGTIRGRLLEPVSGTVDPYEAEERAAIAKG